MSGVWSPGIGHMDGNEDSIDDWRELMLSPRGLFPSSVSDPCLTRLGSNVPIGGGSALEADFQKGFDDSLLKCKDEFEVHENGLSNGVGTDNVAVKTGGSIAERRAAKFGFDTLKINTSRFKSGGALASPAARSPFILRTPGISPSALLESPIMLPNLQPSPTTGAFAFTHIGPEVGMDRMLNSAQIKEENDKSSNDNSSFTFKPHNESISSLRYSSSQNQHPCTVAHNLGVKNDFQCSVATQPPVTVGFEFPTQFPSEATSTKLSAFGSRPESNISRDMVVKASSSESQPACSIGGADIEMQQNSRNTHGEDKGIDQNFDGDQKISNLAVNTSEDGYNWRKYGQKQVKGSEFPRSYFKCTHPNCPVKKKVEHAPDGQVTEIIYKGSHNHEKPQPNKRSTFSSAASCGDSSDVSEGGGSAKAEGGAVWRNSQHDNLDRTCSTSIANGVSDPPLATEAKPVGFVESAGTPEISSTLASNGEDEEEDAAQANLRADDEDAEPDMKRRKLEEGASVEAALGSRAVREPRVIVQIESEVDILDDGYRWRKYGQKVVKGNPNPRSYYKCTFPGCTVRKHVERASHNLKCVLTTYEGKHNHEVPTARNSSHSSSGSGSGNSVSAPALPKPEPQDLAPHSTQKLEYNNRDFMRPNYLNNFAGAPSSIYQMKLPAMPNAMLYGAFRGNPTPEMPPQMRFPVSSNLSIPSYPSREPRLAPVQPIFLGRQPEDGDLTALRQAK